jgi:hypothetical protein
VLCGVRGRGLGIVEFMLEWTTCSTRSEGSLHMFANSHTGPGFMISRSPKNSKKRGKVISMQAVEVVRVARG